MAEVLRVQLFPLASQVISGVLLVSRAKVGEPCTV